MAWPLSQDYNEAIQSPAANFADPDLKRGEAVTNALGLPMPFSGNFADVYEVRGPNGRWAVKCFTREVLGLRERYAEISRHLRQAKLPFTVDFSYLEQGIRVAGRWYPVVKMQWVQGLTLNQFVSQNLEKPATLEALLQLWIKMAKYLRASDVAHCDLQHGNVLLVPGNNANSLALKLIDYDGMWVPALAGTKSGEVGHPSYQHPQRLREGTYSREVDRLPLLLIGAALCALKAAGRPLWEKFDNGDNLLFKEADLRDPARSELFRELSRLGDPATAALMAALRKALSAGLASAPFLEQIGSDGRPATAHAVPPSATIPLAVPVKAPPVVVTVARVEAERNAFGGITAEDTLPDEPPRRAKGAKAAKGGLPGVLVWGGAGAAALMLIACASGGGAVYLSMRGNRDQLALGTMSPAQVETPRAAIPTPATPVGVPTAPAAPFVPPVAVARSVDDLKRVDVSAAALAWAGGGDPRKAAPELVGVLGDPAPTRKPENPLIPVVLLAISPDNKLLASCGQDGNVTFWDLAGRKTLTRSGGSIRLWNPKSLAFRPDGQILVAGDSDGTIRGWGLDGTQFMFGGRGGAANAVAFSPDGKLLATGGANGSVMVWDLMNGAGTRKLRDPGSAVNGVAFSPDGKTLAAACAASANDDTVLIWDVATGESRPAMPCKGSVNKPAFFPDNKRVAALGIATSFDGSAKTYLWSRDQPGAPQNIVTGRPLDLAVRADGRVVTAEQSGTVVNWDPTAKLNAVNRKALCPPDLRARAVALSADATYLAVGSEDGVIALFRLEKAGPVPVAPPFKSDPKPPPHFNP